MRETCGTSAPLADELPVKLLFTGGLLWLAELDVGLMADEDEEAKAFKLDGPPRPGRRLVNVVLSIMSYEN